MILTQEEWKRALRERHGAVLQEKLSGASVAICGLGGLGSLIAIALARAGVGKLILIDFDRVDITNLHRQQYKAEQIGMYKTEAMKKNLQEINPYLEMEIHTLSLGKENGQRLLSGADIICEAFDVPETKAELVNLVLESMPDKYIVAASGMAGWGSGNSIRTRRISRNFYLCGDEKSDVTEEIGMVSSRVMLCAAHQAHMALKIIAEEFEV